MTDSHWSNALKAYLETPEKYPQEVVHHDAKCVILRDKFPKARHHFLVMPRGTLDSVTDLKAEHLPLLQDMRSAAVAYVKRIGGNDKEYKMGFHAIPSMRQLHMHVISTDFDSTCLKNKKHWNSFNSPFFLSVEDVQEKLRTSGKVLVEKKYYEEMLKRPLQCHRCDAIPPNIPKLKAHLAQHGTASFIPVHPYEAGKVATTIMRGAKSAKERRSQTPYSRPSKG